MPIRKIQILCIVLGLLFRADYCDAQDLEPRRWSQLPTGLNFAGVGYGYVSGDIAFDPVLLIENANFTMHNVALFYMRSLDVLGRSARIDFLLPYKTGRWEGTVDGEFVHLRRRGLGDARVRFSILLYGGPAQSRKEFSESKKSNTVVGAAVSLSIPIGEYRSEKLINLGTNRWVARPQLGITHTRGKWTGELTGSLFISSDNNHFWKETQLEVEPLYAMQAHLIYTIRPGLWLSYSTGYGWGAKAVVNGVHKDNAKSNWLNALSVGVPLSRTQGVKLAWLRGRTQAATGNNFDSLILAYSVMF